MDLRLTNRIETIKRKEMQAIAKVESSVLKGLRKYFESNNFVEIVVPHITKITGACENIKTLFSLDYFGRRAYLSQTGQLYLEVVSPFLERVWCTIHSFRAEPEVDKRHLTEFTLVEMEFLGNLEELMKHIEGAIYSAVQEVMREREEELELLSVDEERLEAYRLPYKKITYTEAVEILDGVKWGDDLKAQHEKRLVELFDDKPLFITHYPKEIKFFNMRENNENPEVVNSTDLILPFSGEAVGAAEREFRYEKLKKRLLSSQMYKMIVEEGGSIEDFDWYLEFWKSHKGCLHSGCGIGVNRVTQSILGIDDIRLTTIFALNRTTLY